MLRFPTVGLLSSAAALAACSLVNAPGEVIPDTGGTSTTSAGSGGHAGGSTTSSSSSAGGGTCKLDDDCPSSDVPCHRYACVVGGLCQLVTVANGATCDDGLFCTENETCGLGLCVGAAKVCPGVDACNVGACDEPSGKCTTATAPEGTPCDDGDACTVGDSCGGGACQKGSDPCAGLATDCISSVCVPSGAAWSCLTTNKLDGTFCGQSFCSNGQCADGHCDVVPVNEGVACDDMLYCTVNDKCDKGHCVGDARDCPATDACHPGRCDEVELQCVNTPIPDFAPCDDGDPCTAGEFCLSDQCTGGIEPQTYFSEDFSGGGAGWTLGPEWEIGYAQESWLGQDGDDPGYDHSGDGMVAGVNIGGLAYVAYPDPTHPAYYLTSPSFSTNYAGAVYLTFYRWLNTDYQPYMRDTVEVSSDDGATWSVVWENPANETPINDWYWTFQAIDITSYKGSTTRVRWGFSIGKNGVWDEASWNIDSVRVENAPCPS